MKRSTIIIGTVLALSLTACQKELRELQDAEPYNYALTATRESDPKTRATLTDNTTLTWNAEESIAMYTSASKFEKMTTSEGGATATFKGMMEGSATTCAVYPYSIAKSLSSDKVTVELPATREWEAGKVDPPMLATFSTTNPSSLSFKHLGGLVKITLKGVPAKYTSFSFIADKAIVGSFEASVNDSEPKISSSAESSANNALTFTFSNSGATDMDFYIPVPVGEYNFSIKLSAGDSGESLEKSGKVTVERGKYHSLAALTISETSGSGESSTTSTTVPSTHEGTFYLPSTSGTVKLTMEGNTNAVKLAYAYETGAQHPANVNITCTGAVSSLSLNLPESHVEVNGEAAESTVTITNLDASTSTSTLVLGNKIAIGTKLTVTAGSATIGCTVPDVEVKAKAAEDTSTDVVTIKVAEGGNITNKLEVAQGNVEIAAGTVKEIDVKESVGENATVKVAEGASITDKLTVAKAASVEVAGTVKEVAVKTAVSNVTIAAAVETVTISNAKSSTTTETAPVIWVTETGKVTESITDNTTSSGASSVTIVAVNGQTTNTEVGDGQIKVVKNSSGNEISNVVKTPAEYMAEQLKTGGTVTLEDNITGNFTIDNAVTINLNGHKIANKDAGHTFTVALGGSLTIKGEGTVDNTTNRYAAIHNNGTLVLDGGTYTRSAEASGNSYYTILNHGDMTINSGATVKNEGTFSSTVASGYDTWKADGSSKYSYDSSTNKENPTLTINGGTITGGKYNVKHNGTDGTLTVAAGIELSKVKDNGILTAYVTDAIAVDAAITSGAELVKLNNSTIVAYVTSEKALSKAIADTGISTIALNGDITLDDILTIGIDRTLVIDLNGKTLTGRTNLTKGNVTFKNGKIAGGAEQALNVYGSSDSSATNYSVLTVEKDVTVTADVFAVCIFGNAATTNGYGVKVTLNGTIETKGNGKDGAVFVSGNLGQNVDTDFAASKKNTVWIYGTVTSETDAAVAINGAASVYVQGSAKLTGNTGVAIKRGLLSVTNGTITGNGACYSSPAANPNGTEMSGSAVHASDTYSKYGPLSVLIGGGTFTSAAYTILNNSSCAFNISGGTFSSTLEDTAIAVWARRGDINITGGTFETSSNKEATVYVGTNAENLNGNSPKLTISGKKTVVKNTADGEYAYNSKLKPLAVNMYNTLGYKAVEISGGTFYGNNPTQDDNVKTEYGKFLADGYSVYELDGAYIICPAGEEEVSKLKAQLVDDATVTVSESVTLASVLQPTGKNTTLVLANDAVITGKGQSSGSAREAIMTSKSLTLKGKGTIKADISTDATKSSVLRVGGGIVNIEDGVTLESGSGNEANYAVRIVKGTVNIKGGYFHSSNTGTCELIYLESAFAASSKCYLNISGGVFECDGDASYMINCYDSYRSKCTVSITGGTFVGFNPADNIAEGEHTNFCAEGYTTEKTTYNGKDAWKVVKATE